ncbi:hypothetical protein TNCV_2008301 [Trichonephila clavipes]|nr:hypothetical protein TNCV_2008301 [Trichonephila clavipes]
MVEVKPINLSLNQHSPSLSVRTAISPTLTERIIIHPSVYSEIKKLGHAKSDVLLNESESSLGAHAYAYPNILLWYPWKGKKEYVPLRTADSQDSRYGMQPKARQSSRAGAAKTRTETFELVEEKQKLLDIREKRERERRRSASCSKKIKLIYSVDGQCPKGKRFSEAVLRLNSASEKRASCAQRRSN